MKKHLKDFLYKAPIAILCAFSPHLATGDWVTTLEHTEHWAAGDAVTQNDICSGDINGDGDPEIVSLSTTNVDGRHHAELRVSRWDGSAYNVLDEQLWSVSDQATRGRGVRCVDLVGDGALDIVTGVDLRTASGSETEIRVWRWDAPSESLLVEGEPLVISGSIHALAVGDADADGVAEIITGGGSSSTSELELRIFRVSDSGLSEEHTEDWLVDSGGGEVFGVATADVDADGDPEIVTASDLSDPEAMDLRIWRWNGSALVLEAEVQWDAGGGTDARGVAVGNVDEDTLPEIAVAGTVRNTDLTHPHPLSGVVSLWQWDGETLELEGHRVWQSLLGNVEYFGVSVANIDGAGADEVVVVGPLHEVPAQNVLRVYGWDGGHLQAEYSEEWIAEGMNDNFTYVVHTANVDGDARVEMITGGRAVDAGAQNHHQITIWQLDWSPSFWLWSWMDRMKQVFAWEGWPFYTAFRDTLPIPWGGVVYGGILFGFSALAVYALWRMRSFFTHNRKP